MLINIATRQRPTAGTRRARRLSVDLPARIVIQGEGLADILEEGHARITDIN